MKLSKKKDFILFIFLFNLETSSVNAASIEYYTPAGFEAEEIGFSNEYLINIDGASLPATAVWSSNSQGLKLNESRTGKDEFFKKKFNLVKKILSQLKKEDCQNWCKKIILGHKVELDSEKKIIVITNSDSDYYSPDTKFGFLHNNYVDFKKSSDAYSYASLSGTGYVGLPGKTFGVINWYYNKSQYGNRTNIDKSIGSWYVQKNFNNLYLRSGTQDSRDYATNINNNMNIFFKRFITIGSQDNLLRGGENKKSLLFIL